MVRHDPQRRLWLRLFWLLAWAPLLPGCGKTPSGPTPTTAPPSAPAAGAADQATEPGKISKAAAEYRERPNGEHQCANCALFNATAHSCTLVSGTISPNGWCKYWAARPAT
jgi:hypothetical protein